MNTREIDKSINQLTLEFLFSFHLYNSKEAPDYWSLAGEIQDGIPLDIFTLNIDYVFKNKPHLKQLTLDNPSATLIQVLQNALPYFSNITLSHLSAEAAREFTLKMNGAKRCETLTLHACSSDALMHLRQHLMSPTVTTPCLILDTLENEAMKEVTTSLKAPHCRIKKLIFNNISSEVLKTFLTAMEGENRKSYQLEIGHSLSDDTKQILKEAILKEKNYEKNRIDFEKKVAARERLKKFYLYLNGPSATIYLKENYGPRIGEDHYASNAEVDQYIEDLCLFANSSLKVSLIRGGRKSNGHGCGYTVIEPRIWFDSSLKKHDTILMMDQAFKALDCIEIKGDWQDTLKKSMKKAEQFSISNLRSVWLNRERELRKKIPFGGTSEAIVRQYADSHPDSRTAKAVRQFDEDMKKVSEDGQVELHQFKLFFKKLTGKDNFYNIRSYRMEEIDSFMHIKDVEEYLHHDPDSELSQILMLTWMFSLYKTLYNICNVFSVPADIKNILFRFLSENITPTAIENIRSDATMKLSSARAMDVRFFKHIPLELKPLPTNTSTIKNNAKL